MSKPAILTLLLATATHAADFTPPPEAISLEDSRMAEVYANPAGRPVITGRFTDVPEEWRGKLEVGCATADLLTGRQTTRPVPLAADGSFRIEFPDTVPLREVLLTMGRAGQMTVLLAKDLDLAFHFVPGQPRPDVKVTGTDEPLYKIVTGFRAYERTKREALLRRIPSASKKTGDFAAALADIVEAKRGLDELLRAHAPAEYGWVLQQELDAQYMMAVLSLAFINRQPLAGTPQWEEIVNFRPFIVSRTGLAYYRYLGYYLDMAGDDDKAAALTFEEIQPGIEERMKSADPALAAAYREMLVLMQQKPEAGTADEAKLKANTELLKEFGLLTPNRADLLDLKIRRLRDRIPAEKLDFILLYGVPAAPTEAVEVCGPIAAHAGSRWTRMLVASLVRQRTEQAGAAGAVLAQATVSGGADLGADVITLPTGAKLVRLPELTGAQLLAQLKRVYAGRALLLDFWGPWCAPCLEDLPFSRKVHDAVKDAPVEFIYLGCRTTEPQWKEAIARLGLAGTHVLLTDAQNNELMALFQNTGYPSYVFIDRKGVVRPGAITRLAHTTPGQLRRLLE